MLEKLRQIKDKAIGFWNRTTLTQRIIGFTLLLTLLGLIILLIVNATKTDYVQIYAGLSERETGEISAKLSEKGIKYKLTPDGKGISVPSDVATQVKVDLAAEGIPKTGVLYDNFAQNMNLGLTDREFSVVERDATQNELRRMILNGIKGINDAQVMIQLPKESIWVNQDPGEASASIILNIDPSYPINQKQINALYTLVSKSIPNLPVENIIITNQYGEELTPDFESTSNALATDDFQKLNNIKKEIEKDIERGITQILGTIVGPGNVVVKAFATMDYTQESRQENLVSSPTEDNNGLVISMENLSETWNGQGTPGVGGIVGPGNTDVPGYQAQNQIGGNSEYEKTSEKANYEINRITKSIVESPYKIGDLSISVGVNTPIPNPNNAAEVQRMTQLNNDIKQVVMSVVRTALAKQGTTLSDAEIEKRITVMATPFNTPLAVPEKKVTPWLIYSLIAAGVLLIAGLIFYFISRKKRSAVIEKELEPTLLQDTSLVDLAETEESMVKKQIERLAKEKPQEFVSLLRTWIAED